MADKIDDPKVSVEELKKVVAAKMEQLSSIESKQRNKESEGEQVLVRQENVD